MNNTMLMKKIMMPMGLDGRLEVSPGRQTRLAGFKTTRGLGRRVHPAEHEGARPLVYFICHGNAMRSQMAEAFLREHAGDRFEAASAGMSPAGSVFPEVEQVMREIRISLDGHTSDPIDPGLVERAALIVDMSGRARTRIPLAYRNKLVEWDVADPVGAGEPVLRRTRDEIGKRVRALVEGWPGHLPERRVEEG